MFVDEDGNPIEAGHENLLYVDESGHEIPEDIAMQLLETGKYIDSRDLCLETPANETQPRSSNATFLSNASASNTTPANGSHPSHSASLPASAFGSLSKATGSRQQRDLQQASDVVVRKAASSQILLQASTVVGADVQTRTQTQHSSFVTNEPAQRSYQRDKELDQVELDNVSFALAASELQRKTANDNYTKSVSNVDMQKSQSARRLIQPPPKRTDTRQSNDSYISSQQASQKHYRYQASPSTAPACQTYNLNQLVESPTTPQPTSSAQQRQQLPSQSPYVSSAYEYQPSENNLTQQQYEEEVNREEEEEATYALEEQQLRRRQQEIIDNEILRSSSQPPESPYYYDPQSQSQSQQQQRQPSRLSQYSQASRSTNSRPATNQRLPSAASSHRDLGALGQFEVVQFRRLGDLRGDQIIRDISQLTDEDINRLYSLNEDPEAEDESNDQNDEHQFIDPADPNLFKDEIVDIDFGAIDAYTSALNAQINSVNNESSAANDLQFPSHILTSSHATFLDNQLLLGDAFYGRDDDVATAGENANNETNGDDNTSNAEVACNPAGFSVQLLNSFKDFENLGAQAHDDDLQSNQGGQSNNNNEPNNNQENAEYSNSHSFGSVVDIDNCQPGYTIGDLSNFNLSNLNLNSSHQNYELLDPSGSKYNAKPSSRQQQPTSSSGVFYLNSENQENCYVR